LPRPPKLRNVAFFPYLRYFKPAGVPMTELQEEVLTVEEIEALRLKDLEGLDQDSCAEMMGVSQSTFQRMLAGARFKLVRGLIEGKAIRIEGGRYELAGDRFRCLGCGEEWDEELSGPGQTGERLPVPVCPKCGRGPVATVFGRPMGPRSPARRVLSRGRRWRG